MQEVITDGYPLTCNAMLLWGAFLAQQRESYEVLVLLFPWLHPAET